MRCLNKIPDFSTALLVFILFLLPAAAAQQRPPVAAAQNPPRQQPRVSAPQANPIGSVVKIEGLTREQFRALAPNALVSYNGQTMTKASFIAQRLREYAATAKANQSKTAVNLAAVQAQFAQKQQADLAARNAKVQYDWIKFQQDAKRVAESPTYLALSKEAADLVSRYNAASPAEKAKLKQRALEVYNRLRQMENTVATARQ